MRTFIYGGRVIDPANHVDGRLNLLLEDGRIAGVSTGQMEADVSINAQGKIVCPGFIDIHVHEDPVDANGCIEVDEKTSVFSCMLRMGVTTTVCGNCGENVCDPGDYLDLVDRDGVPVNVAMQAGHEYFRFLSGATDRYGPATDRQISFMVEGIRKSLDRGCVGLSYGIRYVPGVTKDELWRTVAATQGTGKVVASHIRDDTEQVFGALAEFMDAANAVGAPAQISHIGSMAGFGQMERFLQMVDAYKLSGADVMCDCYPYSAFSTGIGSTTYDDGWLERYGCDYSVLELCEGEYKGRRCTEEIFRKVRREMPNCRTVCYVMRPEEIDIALTHPAVLLCSDATMNQGQGHPRAAGSFPRLIARYVRTGKLSLYDAIAKMTSLPARRYGLKSKGRLDVGADADVVIFDPERIQDNATFEQPILPPDGIDYVFVNGTLAARDGKIAQLRCGRSVRL